MHNTIFISNLSYPSAVISSTRLDSVLSSAEAALARAEEHLRQTQRTYMCDVLSELCNRAVLKRSLDVAGRH